MHELEASTDPLPYGLWPGMLGMHEQRTHLGAGQEALFRELLDADRWAPRLRWACVRTRKTPSSLEGPPLPPCPALQLGNLPEAARRSLSPRVGCSMAVEKLTEGIEGFSHDWRQLVLEIAKEAHA
jgi:hypothetical protein